MTTSNWLSTAQAHFPSLNESNCQLTSPADGDYNCIAWAAEADDRWWWPDPMQQDYWPTGAPRAETIEAFISAFGLLGYSEKTDSSVESQKQKVAIFMNEVGTPTHVARQLSDGLWTSKLGKQEDIAHELSALVGSTYGRVAIVLARHTGHPAPL